MKQLDGESFTRILHINVVGSFLMAPAASKPLIEQGRQSVVGQTLLGSLAEPLDISDVARFCY